MTSLNGPRSTKRDLRHAARRRRRRLAAELDQAAAGLAIVEALLPLVRAPARVAVYESLPTEPPTGPLIAALTAAGCEVIVPVTLADFSLDWRYAVPGAVAGPATTARRTEGTKGTDGTDGTDGTTGGTLGRRALAACSLVVAPGLAVDRRGVRLGQGGGCYDRALAALTPGVPVLTLLHEGEASSADLPCDEHDERVDGYVTTSGRLVWLTGRSQAPGEG